MLPQTMRKARALGKRPYRYSVYRVCFGKLRALGKRPYKTKPLAFGDLRTPEGRPYSFKLKQKNKSVQA